MGEEQSLDQTALRPSVIKRFCQVILNTYAKYTPKRTNIYILLCSRVECHIYYIYHQFIVRFLMGLDFFVHIDKE